MGMCKEGVRKSLLGSDFVPSNYTVLCGRGKDCFNFVGNRRFRIIVDMNLERYALAPTKSEKTQIVTDIVELVRMAGGCFAKKEDGVWLEVGDAVAREKVGALLRDCLHQQYRSSSKAKTARRQAQKLKIPQSPANGSDDDYSVSTERSIATSSESSVEANQSPRHDRFSFILGSSTVGDDLDLEFSRGTFAV